MSAYTAWTPDDARHSIAVPGTADDKYSRGVLGMVTGSTRFPGAAVLGVEAALHTGLGMVRYLGPTEVGTLVLQRRPEIVLGDGRVQAWLLGSGIDAAHRPAALISAFGYDETVTGVELIRPHSGVREDVYRSSGAGHGRHGGEDVC